jgi:hypothetical protein
LRANSAAKRADCRKNFERRICEQLDDQRPYIPGRDVFCPIVLPAQKTLEKSQGQNESSASHHIWQTMAGGHGYGGGDIARNDNKDLKIPSNPTNPNEGSLTRRAMTRPRRVKTTITNCQLRRRVAMSATDKKTECWDLPEPD